MITNIFEASLVYLQSGAILSGESVTTYLPSVILMACLQKLQVLRNIHKSMTAASFLSQERKKIQSYEVPGIKGQYTMISAEHAKMFTHHWSITISGRPSLRYVHTTLSNLDQWLEMLTTPSNGPQDESWRSKDWKRAEIKKLKATTTQKYIDALTKFNALNMMIEVDGQPVGGANYGLLPTGGVNMGVILMENARGKGLGKLTMQVLIKLGHRMGIRRLQAGTMKSNQAMQAVMASLNIPGRDEIQESPGRGIVGEILYEIPETVDWEEIDLQLEFGGPVPDKA